MANQPKNLHFRSPRLPESLCSCNRVLTDEEGTVSGGGGEDVISGPLPKEAVRRERLQVRGFDQVPDQKII